MKSLFGPILDIITITFIMKSYIKKIIDIEISIIDSTETKHFMFCFKKGKPRLWYFRENLFTWICSQKDCKFQFCQKTSCIILKNLKIDTVMVDKAH